MRLALRRGVVVLGWIVAGCECTPAEDFDAWAMRDAGAPLDAYRDDSPGLDAPLLDGGPVLDARGDDAGTVELVDVQHRRELRGVWVASVSNLDFPSRTGLTPEAARAELETMFERVAAAGLNAVFFQVRPESDALYFSTYEPWSRYLTGTQGRDPGYDPLALVVELGHRRGIEVHAWLNPYRGLSSASTVTAPNHVTRTLAAHAIRYNGAIVMDPGAAPVRNHVNQVVHDLVQHYDLDGIHFDDYFYPYPDEAGTPFPDDTSWNAYRTGGGTLSRADWRRENVNTLIREVRATIDSLQPRVRFGVSPFGIYRPGMPAGITGLDAYATIYCDALAWLREDSVDYVAPQLYWPTTQTAQAFGPLLTWWGGQVSGEHVFAGHALYRLGSTAAWTVGEVEAQIALVHSALPAGRVGGSIHFRYRQLADDTMSIRSALSRRYALPAVPPVQPGLTERPAPPTVRVEGNVVTVSHDDPFVRRYFLYRGGTTWTLDSSFAPLGSEGGRWTLPTGTYAVSVTSLGDAESQGVRVVVP